MLMVGSALADGKVKWGYEGNIGPANWGDLSSEFAMCKTGKVQAPIDISTKGLAKATTPIKTDYSPSKASVVIMATLFRWTFQVEVMQRCQMMISIFCNFICTLPVKKLLMASAIHLMLI